MKRTLTWLLPMAILTAGCAGSSKPPASMAATETKPVLTAKSAFEDGAADSASGEKGIFVETSATRSKRPAGKASGPASTRYRGFSYWIEQEGKSSNRRVTSSTLFSSGDRIRFHVRSNMSGYLYVVAQGTSGINKIIYPVGDGQTARMEANKEYALPSKGAVVFDENAGDEVLWFFISQNPLPGSPDRRDGIGQGQTVASADVDATGCGSKDLLLIPDALDRECGFKKRSGGTKDLLVEDDSASAEPAGYVVGDVDRLLQGTLLSLRLVLRHR